MATKTTEYISCTRVYCGTPLPKEVIVCVPYEIVSSKSCPNYPFVTANQPYEYGWITAEITKEQQLDNDCNNSRWKYWLTYEEEELIEGALLVGTDITGVFCKNCFTTWVEESIGNEAWIRTNEDNSQTFVSQHGCEYNIDTAGIGVSDTNSIDLTLSSGTLSADSKISSNSENIISIQADGLYAYPTFIPLYVDTTQVGITGGVADSILMSYTIPALTLNTNKQYLEISASGSFASNSNAKTLKVFLGVTTILDIGSVILNSQAWSAQIKLVRTAVNVVTYYCQVFSNTGTLQTINSGSQVVAWNSSNLLKFTGTSLLTNDVTQNILTVAKVRQP